MLLNCTIWNVWHPTWSLLKDKSIFLSHTGSETVGERASDDRSALEKMPHYLTSSVVCGGKQHAINHCNRPRHERREIASPATGTPLQAVIFMLSSYQEVDMMRAMSFSRLWGEIIAEMTLHLAVLQLRDSAASDRVIMARPAVTNKHRMHPFVDSNPLACTTRTWRLAEVCLSQEKFETKAEKA